MSSLGFREGRRERPMKYGRRDVKCSGAVELVVFVGGGEEMGVPCSGGTGSYQSSPDLSCRLGRYCNCWSPCTKDKRGISHAKD